MSKNIKVGIFVSLALAVSAIFVFMIGDNRRMWETKVMYRSCYLHILLAAVIWTMCMWVLVPA